jgi:hypothetical protein
MKYDLCQNNAIGNFFYGNISTSNDWREYLYFNKKKRMSRDVDLATFFIKIERYAKFYFVKQRKN